MGNRVSDQIVPQKRKRPKIRIRRELHCRRPCKDCRLFVPREIKAVPEQWTLEQLVEVAMAGLTDRERYVLELWCGHRGDPVRQADLAAEFHLSTTRVGQIERTAIRKMRKPHQRLAMFQQLLPAVLSRGKDDFYTRLFIKLFWLKREDISNILNS